MSMVVSGVCLLRISKASAIQFMVTGWREGRMPVAERMESPFGFFLGWSSVTAASLSLASGGVSASVDCSLANCLV